MIPDSKFKREIARILDEQGYIEGFEVTSRRAGRADRGSPQVH